MPTALNKGFVLFIQVDEPSELNGGVDLVVHGVSNSGLTGGVDLFVQCASGEGNIFSGVLPLTVLGPTSDDLERGMNLFVEGCGNPVSLGMDLVVWNEQSGATQSATLFIEGSGTTEGCIPVSRGMNLFLRRNPAAACPLYICGPGTTGNLSTNLFVHGAAPTSGTIPFVIPDAVGFVDDSVRLYTHGI